MHKLVIMYPQPADRKQFLEYYENSHLPKVKDLPGLISAEYGCNDDHEAPIFVMFTALFADKASLDSALGSEVGLALAMDIPNFSPAGVTKLSRPTSQVVSVARTS